MLIKEFCKVAVNNGWHLVVVELSYPEKGFKVCHCETLKNCKFPEFITTTRDHERVWKHLNVLFKDLKKNGFSGGLHLSITQQMDIAI